ncbi:carboxypeptidase-like regulatory domain-containing protein [Flavobacterium bizetiae]|uniref:carboxypeptidase-like regulatory domain-containing protein n=1 Tax=Flavobacterium bizetiae TaxID=2704140 RepID=UPI0021E8F4F4|nr:carboxypeptidase-like regulatory domain-containing protein [Flavobacterium bizetiae]UTN02714.1 carboxypeptidase-like regulatory domain-containing protein [Flavobacterium bizetiae]
MRKFVYLFIFLLTISCNNSKYYGYVYNFEKRKPLEGVKVYDVCNKRVIITDKDGYFEIDQTKNCSGTLVFQKTKFHSDTIRSISIQSGEFMREVFKGDTIYLRLIKN